MKLCVDHSYNSLLTVDVSIIQDIIFKKKLSKNTRSIINFSNKATKKEEYFFQFMKAKSSRCIRLCY